jgi:hypothetical protein
MQVYRSLSVGSRREAREPLGITYHDADAADLSNFEDAVFDLADILTEKSSF